MQMTRRDLIFFNSITPGTHIWGIPLKFKRTEDFPEIYQAIIDGLTRKKFLKSDKQLSVLGGAAAKRIDDYKQANKYVLVNRMHIALLPNMDAVIIVEKESGQFEILRQNRAAIFVEILRSNQRFCAAGDGRNSDSIFPLESFLEEVRDYPGNMLVGKFDNNRSMEEGILFWNEQNIYYFDVKKEKKSMISAPQVRNFLAEILELKGGTANG